MVGVPSYEKLPVTLVYLDVLDEFMKSMSGVLVRLSSDAGGDKEAESGQRSSIPKEMDSGVNYLPHCSSRTAGAKIGIEWQVDEVVSYLPENAKGKTGMVTYILDIPRLFDLFSLLFCSSPVKSLPISIIPKEHITPSTLRHISVSRLNIQTKSEPDST